VIPISPVRGTIWGRDGATLSNSFKLSTFLLRALFPLACICLFIAPVTATEGDLFTLGSGFSADGGTSVSVDELVLADEIGVRVAGSDNERTAQNYIASRLERYGYLALVSDPFPLHNGRTSRNVWAEIPGQTDDIILIGAHYDSKSPAPGANDNGSGVAVVLELARLMADIVPPYTVRFAFFGSEEIIDGNSDHHHYGSRFMSEDAALREMLHSATSVDMVGVGSELWIDNIGIADDGWRSHLYDIGSALGYPVWAGEHREWSDHEAFEHKGVPVAWVHWRYDSNYHQVTDTSDRIDPELLAMTVELMLRGVLEIEGASDVPCADGFDYSMF